MASFGINVFVTELLKLESCHRILICKNGDFYHIGYHYYYQLYFLKALLKYFLPPKANIDFKTEL